MSEKSLSAWAPLPPNWRVSPASGPPESQLDEVDQRESPPFPFHVFVLLMEIAPAHPGQNTTKAKIRPTETNFSLENEGLRVELTDTIYRISH